MTAAGVNLPRPIGDHPAGENVFWRYGQLDVLRQGTRVEDLLAEMDGAGVATAALCGEDLAWVAETCRQHPARFFGIVCPDPRDIMACLRTIERAVRDHGFKGVKIEPFL